MWLFCQGSISDGTGPLKHSWNINIRHKADADGFVVENRDLTKEILFGVYQLWKRRF